jgi:hypothetical protein
MYISKIPSLIQFSSPNTEDKGIGFLQNVQLIRQNVTYISIVSLYVMDSYYVQI